MLVKSQVKYIQSLGQKKLRDEEGVFIAEGPKILAEFLSSPFVRVLQVYALKEWIEQGNDARKDIAVSEVSEDELGKISQLATPNQVVAVVQKFEAPVIDTRKVVSLALDNVQDPGNVGTIIRIADWFGISQVICSAACADLYNPKVVQASMGSIARVKMHYTELADWLARQENIPIYGASLEGQDVRAVKIPAEAIVVIGNESKGISAEVMKLVKIQITIPRKGLAESLNAAVATGIILSHLAGDG